MASQKGSVKFKQVKKNSKVNYMVSEDDMLEFINVLHGSTVPTRFAGDIKK